jgi:O-acetyl-ADP-ribose deacetylase (regulator of RNase III)
MLVYLESDLFTSPAQTLVNTVNTEGVMGKGVAKTFKQKYPEMFAEYKRLCDRKELRIGTLMLWRGADHWILNFPTKTTWRLPSRLSYVEEGLKKFVDTHEDLGITSISFPPLGCGNGNLDWKNVKPLMERYLRDLSIPIYVHELHVGAAFVPEHLAGTQSEPAGDLRRLLSDIARLALEAGGLFKTLGRNESFRASVLDNGDLQVNAQGRDETISHEEVAAAWSELQSGLLTTEAGAEKRNPHDDYLFAVLARLPYVELAPVRHLHGGQYRSGHGLFLRRRNAPPRIAAHRQQVQGRLWP